MAEIEDSPDNVDNPFSDQDFLDSGPPLPEELLAKMKKLLDVAGGDPNEVLQNLLKQKLQGPVGPLQPLLSSQFFVLLTLLLLITSIFGKKFVLVLNITLSIHYTDICFL